MISAGNGGLLMIHLSSVRVVPAFFRSPAETPPTKPPSVNLRMSRIASNFLASIRRIASTTSQMGSARLRFGLCAVADRIIQRHRHRLVPAQTETILAFSIVRIGSADPDLVG